MVVVVTVALSNSLDKLDSTFGIKLNYSRQYLLLFGVWIYRPSVGTLLLLLCLMDSVSHMEQMAS